MKDLVNLISESIHNDASFRQWVSDCTRQFNHVMSLAVEQSDIVNRFNIDLKFIEYSCGYNSKLDEFEGSFWLFGQSDEELIIDMSDVFNEKIDKLSDIIYDYVYKLKRK